jgi:hypothetical protein
LAKITPNPDLPIALAKWYDYTKWVLDRELGVSVQILTVCFTANPTNSDWQ